MWVTRGSIQNSYELKTKLGEGATAEVWLANHSIPGCTKAKTSTGCVKAVKIFEKASRDDYELELIAIEIEMLQKVSHPNIIRLFECFVDLKNIALVTDICEGGELYDEIAKRQVFPEADGIMVIRQLLSCVAYLADKHVLHRDIKPENIMLERANDLSSIKLIDFGHAIEYNPKTDGFLTEILGTPYYIAPEVLQGQYTNKCDIWSVGVLAFILLSGYPPFNGENNDEIFDSVSVGTYSLETDSWDDISHEAKDLIDMLLTFEYTRRPEAKEALAVDIMQPQKVISAVPPKDFEENSSLPSPPRRDSQNVCCPLDI